MKSKFVRVLPLFFVVLASAVPAPAQQTSSNPTVIPPVSYDISPPLVDLVASAPPKAATSQRNIPLRRPRPTVAPPASVTQDSALQQLSLPLVSTSPGLDLDRIFYVHDLCELRGSDRAVRVRWRHPVRAYAVKVQSR